MENKKADIVIISFNTAELTLNCINSVINSSCDIIENIIVVDNASNDDSVNILKKNFPSITIIQNEENLGYSKAVNMGVNFSKNEYVIISNADVIYHDSSISELLKCLDSDIKYGVAGPQQQYPDGSWQYCYGDLPGIKLGIQKLFMIYHLKQFKRRNNWKKGKREIKTKVVPYLDGAVLAVRRSAFYDVAGFDEDYFFFTEEADFCYKLKNKDWKIVHTPLSVVTHIRGAAFEQPEINLERFRKLVQTKSLFCKKNLSFQSSKFYMISEIIYSLWMVILWFIVGQFKAGILKEKAKLKVKTFKTFYYLWIDEFNNYLGNHG